MLLSSLLVKISTFSLIPGSIVPLVTKKGGSEEVAVDPLDESLQGLVGVVAGGSSEGDLVGTAKIDGSLIPGSEGVVDQLWEPLPELASADRDSVPGGYEFSVLSGCNVMGLDLTADF